MNLTINFCSKVKLIFNLCYDFFRCPFIKLRIVGLFCLTVLIFSESWTFSCVALAKTQTGSWTAVYLHQLIYTLRGGVAIIIRYHQRSVTYFLILVLKSWKELQLHQNSSIMKLTHIIFLLLSFCCIAVNCIEDHNLSFRDRKLGWQRINSGGQQSKVLKKRRKVLKRRPSASSEKNAKSTFIRPFNRDSRCKLPNETK